MILVRRVLISLCARFGVPGAELDVPGRSWERTTVGLLFAVTTVGGGLDGDSARGVELALGFVVLPLLNPELEVFRDNEFGVAELFTFAFGLKLAGD